MKNIKDGDKLSHDSAAVSIPEKKQEPVEKKPAVDMRNIGILG